MKDHIDKLLIEVGELHHGVEGDASALLDLEVDVWGPRVEPYAHILQLLLKEHPLNVSLGGIKHHHDHVSRLSHSNNLATTTLAYKERERQEQSETHEEWQR